MAIGVPAPIDNRRSLSNGEHCRLGRRLENGSKDQRQCDEQNVQMTNEKSGAREKGRRGKKRRKRVGRERGAGLDGEKVLVRDWSGKTMNAAVRSIGFKRLPFLPALGVPFSQISKCQVPDVLCVLYKFEEVAKELEVEVDITLPWMEFKKRICQSKYYTEEVAKCLLKGILEEKREEREEHEKREIKKFEERRLAREFELKSLRAQLSNKLNENELKAWNRINNLANVCILPENRTGEVSEPVNKCRPLINPVVNKSAENATSCDFENENCDPHGSFELKGDKGVTNPEGLIGENICEEKYTIGALMGCEKQLTVDQESFRNHTMAKIARQLDGKKENMCKANVRKGLGDGLAMRLPLSEPREIYKDDLETDSKSNIGSEFNFEIDLPGKRDRSTIYRLNLIKLYRRKPELANLVMENSSEGIDSETLYSVKLFMDFGFQGNLRKSQLYFKLPPDRSSYLRMINSKKKERFLSDPGMIVLRQKDINLFTGKPFRIKTCCSSQMLINSLREDTEYLLDFGVNGMGQSNRTLPVVWKEQRGIVGQQIDFVLKWLRRVGSEVGPTKGKLEPWASLFRVHNVDIVKSFHELTRRKGKEREKEKKKSRERGAGLDGEKGLVRNWSEKKMNAGGVEK
ncbi:uncharacterized protein TNCV_4019111 [Trichonephila clavipes]|nr:uncharacterized protein TNCV_4019111 [Trichonephila clavipes]